MINTNEPWIEPIDADDSQICESIEAGLDGSSYKTSTEGNKERKNILEWRPAKGRRRSRPKKRCRHNVEQKPPANSEIEEEWQAWKNNGGILLKRLKSTMVCDSQKRKTTMVAEALLLICYEFSWPIQSRSKLFEKKGLPERNFYGSF